MIHQPDHSHGNDPPPSLLNPRFQTLPPGTGTFGLILFLLALGVLFGASVIGYIIIRITSPQAPPLFTISMPAGLWVSTFILLASSLTMHVALTSVRRERQRRFRIAMLLTLALALAFLIVQAPSLYSLLQDHRAAQSHEEGFAIYGLIFFFICVHAAHLIGGLVPMIVTYIRAIRHRYDHEYHNPIKHLAMYWHFLDGAWLALFLAFLATG